MIGIQIVIGAGIEVGVRVSGNNHMKIKLLKRIIIIIIIIKIEIEIRHQIYPGILIINNKIEIMKLVMLRNQIEIKITIIIIVKLKAIIILVIMRIVENSEMKLILEKRNLGIIYTRVGK